MTDRENSMSSCEEEDIIDVVDMDDMEDTISQSQPFTSTMESTMETSITPVIPPIRDLPSPPLSQASTTSSVSQDRLFESPAAAASRYIRNFQLSNKATKSERESKGEGEEADVEDTESEDGHDGDKISRKEKSLGLLCQRFLIAMKAETEANSSNTVHLESVARKMNVEKRRIYDIVNVMEALEAMSKTNKSYYYWHGLEDLPKLMADLQKEAAEERLPERILRVEQAMCSFTELSPSSRKGADTVGSLICSDEKENIPPSSSLVSPFPSISLQKNDSGYFGSSQEKPQERRQRTLSKDKHNRNSLAQLCRRFIMVLLCNPKTVRKVSLDVASTVLIKDPETEGFEPPSRSRCRRLYDIANVLVAMGLIKKVHYLFGTKKIPLFVYSGPEPDENGTFDASVCLTQSLLSSPVSCPQTPLTKAAQLGKRSQSELNLSGGPKLARYASDFGMSSMMRLAELADQERQRIMERQQTTPHSSPVGMVGGNTLPRPNPQRVSSIVRPPSSTLSLGSLPSPLSSPLTHSIPVSPLTNQGRKSSAHNVHKMGANFAYSPMSSINMGSTNQNMGMSAPSFTPIVLPKTPSWIPHSAQDYNAAAQFLRTMAVASRTPTSTVFSRMSQLNSGVQDTLSMSMPSPKHSVSHILGVSSKSNLDHLDTSPFQVVQKKKMTVPSPMKKPFGTSTNFNQ